LNRTRDFIQEQQLDASIVATERPLHATELTRQAIAEGCDTVVAIGGDGTINEVATGLIDTQANLGLIPCGSGNGLGRHLGIPRPNQLAFETLLKGRHRVIDTGVANGRPFFNVMGLGFDADIANRFTKLTKRGFQAYVRTTLSAWSSYQAQNVIVRNGDQRIESPALILSVANSDQFGNNCYIAPGAQIDDGLIDLTIIKPVGIFKAIPLAMRLFLGSIGGSPHTIRLQGSEFIIERPSDDVVHVDGEPFSTSAKVTVTVRPNSLRVLVPADS
jgi:YegS/Rv2252/BmrU family lipid kinase